MPSWTYHVFLSHASTDKPLVEKLARRLKAEQIEPWLDKWNLIPGEPWQPAIEQALADCATCAVFIGPGGFGAWQNEEMRAAIDRRVGDSGGLFRVIPVLLPDVERPERSKLPTFLVATSWVEFRKSLDEPEPFRRLICGIRGEPPGSGPEGMIAEGVCPYRGLDVFDVEHARFYFGREALVEWLLNALRASPARAENRFLAILGASGSGKSSLARAGLVPALRRGEIDGSAEWPVTVFRPGADPLESLAVALAKIDGSSASPVVLQGLMAAFRADERTLHQAARLALRDAPPTRRLVVVVDQFEEVFTVCPDESARAALIANLLYAANAAHSADAANATGGQAIVILTMRADFYGKCASYPALAAAMSDHQVLVGPMTEDELRRSIERPAELVGLEFEPGLAAALIRDVKDQAGGLPLLQYALLELWKRRDGRRLTADAYGAIGGLQGALENRANEVLHGLSPAERELCRRIFLRLTQPGEGTEDTKRRAAYRELRPTEADAPAVDAVVRKLADARLITTEGKKEGSVEVAHEALIRGWSELRKWIDADRAGLRTLSRLREAAHEWEASHRDPTFLDSGARLAVASEWAAKHHGELNALEAEFLAESQKRRRDELDAVRRSASRLRWLVRGLAAVVVLASVLAAFAYSEKRKADKATGVATKAEGQAKEHAKIAKAKAKEAGEQAQEALRQTRIASAQRLAALSQATLEHTPRLSLLLAAEAMKATERGEPRVAAAEEALRHALSSTGGRILGGLQAPVDHALVSADGQRLATIDQVGQAQVWSVKDLSAQPLVLRHRGGVALSAFSPDGRWLAASDRQTTRVWDLLARDPAQTFLEFNESGGGTRGLDFSPDSRRLATASTDGIARVWDLTAAGPSKPIHELMGHIRYVMSVAFSPDGRRLATGGVDNTVRLWDLTDADPSKTSVALTGHTSFIKLLRFSRDGRRLVSADDAASVRLWGLDPGDPAATCVVLEPGRGSARDLWIDPTAGRITVAYDSGEVASYEPGPTGASRGPRTLKPASTLLLPDARFSKAVTFSRDGHRILIAMAGAVQVWNTDKHDREAKPIVCHGHDADVMCVALTPDARWLITGGEDGIARVWDLEEPYAAPVDLRNRGRLAESAISSAGGRHWVATSDEAGGIVVWDLQAPDPASTCSILRNEGPDVRLTISPDDRWLAAAGREHATEVWDLGSRPIKTLANLPGSGSPTNHTEFSPDGRRLAVADSDGKIRVWDLLADRPAERPVDLEGHKGRIHALTFSRDGSRLASAGADLSARVWDLQAARPVESCIVLGGHKLRPPGHHVRDSGDELIPILSADGRRLVTVDWTQVRVWDLAARDPAASPRVLPLSHRPMALGPDGRWLVASDGGTVLALDLKVPNAAAKSIVLPGWLIVVDRLPEGRRLVTADSTGTVRIWNLEAPDPTANPLVFRGDRVPVAPSASSPDGSRRPVRAQSRRRDGVGSAAFSPDGSRLVTADGGAVRVWNLLAPGSPAVPVTLRGHSEPIDAKLITNDGHWLITSDGRSWDLSGPVSDPVALEASEPSLTPLAVSRDSRWVVCLADYRTALGRRLVLWDLRLDELVARAGPLVGRNFTDAEWYQYFPGTDYRWTFRGLPKPPDKE